MANPELWAMMGQNPQAAQLGFTPEEYAEYYQAVQAAKKGAPAGTFAGAEMGKQVDSSAKLIEGNTRDLGDAVKSAKYANLLNDAYLTSLQDQRAGVQRQESIMDRISALPQEMDLKPLAGLVETLSPQAAARGFSKHFTAPTTELDKLQLLAKLENQIQAQRGGVTSKDLAVLKLSQLPPNILTTDTKGTLKVEAPKAPPSNSSGSQEDKQAEKYIKATEGVADMLKAAEEVQGLMEQVKDFSEEDIQGKGAMLGQKALNSMLGSDFSLTENQRRYKQLQKQVALIKQLAQSGKQSADKEYQRVSTVAGGLDFSSKEQFASGVNDIVSALRNKVKGAKIAFPKGAARAASQGGVTEESFKGKTVTPTPAVSPSPKAPVKKFEFKDASKMSAEEQTQYLKDLNEYKASLKK